VPDFRNNPRKEISRVAMGVTMLSIRKKNEITKHETDTAMPPRKDVMHLIAALARSSA
jgi:hypothetical protein